MFKTVPEREHVFAISGMGGDVHQGFTGILFKPWEERNRTQAQILQELQPKVNSIAGGQVLTFGNPSLPGSTGGPPVQFVITTTADYEQLAQVLEKMQRAATESGLFIFSDGDLKFDTPQIEVKIDHAKANSLGITMQDIGASLATLLGRQLRQPLQPLRTQLPGHSAGAARLPPRSRLGQTLPDQGRHRAAWCRFRPWSTCARACSPTR